MSARAPSSGRGLYALPDRDTPADYALATAAKRVPRGVVCLLSALQFHGLTTQLPREVWLAIGEKDWRPATNGMRIRTVRFSPLALREGVETHVIDGVRVKVFNPAKTAMRDDAFPMSEVIRFMERLKASAEWDET